MKPPRIAYCSPVNPAASGISDYSEELLPYLGQYADITLYLEHHLRPTNPALEHFLDVQPLRKLQRDHRRQPYDAILYHIGNSPVHAEIWQVAQKVPGVVVLHEFVLHHFMLWYAANMLHDVRHYMREMRERYGEAGEHVANLMTRGRFTEAAFDFPCAEPVVSAAYGLIAHNYYTKEWVASQRPTLPTAVIPMGVPLPPVIDRQEARSRLGLSADAFILASFGHINAYKRIEPTLRALQTLRIQHPNVRYILVGSVSPNYDLEGIIQRMGLRDVVLVTGYVSRQTFEDYVAAADICLNLRHPTAGETSASLLRLLGAGRPTLVSATGWFAELPTGVAAQVDLGSSERDLILAYCQLFASNPAIAAKLGEQARNYVAKHHTLQHAAQLYAMFLARLYGWKTVMRVRNEPLWNVETTPLPLTNAPVSLSSSLEPPQPEKPVPHSEPLPDLSTLLATTWSLSDIAQRLVEIGITEHHETFLQTVAERIWELEQSKERH